MDEKEEIYRRGHFFSLETMQKMFNKLLTHKRIMTSLDIGRTVNPVEEFPRKILPPYTAVELSKMFDVHDINTNFTDHTRYLWFTRKLSLPLARLYCSTKFLNEDEENEPDYPRNL